MLEQEYKDIYVGGQWMTPASTEVLEVVNPTSERVIGRVPAGTPADIDEAANAASEAFYAWANRSPSDRARYLEAIAEKMKERRDDFVETIIREVGCPRGLTERVQVDAAIATIESTAALAREISFQERMGDSLVLREPLGVVGGITPWNYPLLQIAYKVAPALAAGCVVILKPSELTPLNAYLFADAIDRAGLPSGVFNLVPGYGTPTGEALVSHPLVDAVSFTGSTRAGRQVSRLAADSVKKVTLELGGKSPNILLDDLEGAALAAAVESSVNSAFPNSGQNCGALTRLLVPRNLLAEVEELAIRAAERITVGDPEESETSLGPLVSAAQRDRVLGYIKSGINEGARLLTGGLESPLRGDTGFFVAPTIFADVTPTMAIAREEIFGPVLVILPYDDDHEAVQLANDTEYGLSAAVSGADLERAQAIARQIRAGQVLVNDGRRSIDTPFGGFKLSGHGRECGRYGIEEFLTTKALHLPRHAFGQAQH